MHNHTIRIFTLNHCAYTLKIDRFKIENITCIVIGRNGFGVAVIHNRLDTHVLQCKCSMYAAVVKFDTLPDSIRSATDHHHFGIFHDVLFFLNRGNRRGRVKIGCQCLKFSRAGINFVIFEFDSQLLTAFIDFIFMNTGQLCQHSIGEAVGFGVAQFFFITEYRFVNLFFKCDDLFDLIQKPRIHFAKLKNIFHAVPTSESFGDIENSLGIGTANLFLQHRIVDIEFLKATEICFK